jgi:predicted metal-dependent hydrolase
MKIRWWRPRRARRPTPGRHDYETHREAARALLTARVAHWSEVLAITPGRISIRNQRSRWGSCSEKGNLNFNFRLLFLPGHLVDYVVVHELCHCREFNHSPAFWGLVVSALPDYEDRITELRTYERRRFHLSKLSRYTSPDYQTV